MRNTGLERDGTGHQPHFVLLSLVSQKTLDGAFTLRFAYRDFIGLLHAHDRKILGERDQLCALRNRHIDQAFGFI